MLLRELTAADAEDYSVADLVAAEYAAVRDAEMALSNEIHSDAFQTEVRAARLAATRLGDAVALLEAALTRVKGAPEQ